MGAVFLLPARAMLHARSVCRVQQSLVCNLVPDAVDAWFGEALDWPDHQLVGALDVTSADVRRLLFRIARELKEPGFGSDALVELLAGQVCIELARQFRTMEPHVARGGLTPWRLRLIEEQVTADPGKATLADLASTCGLSVRHLTRAYRISCGRTLGDFIAEQRIDRARTLLSKGMSIKQTAFAVGFTAPSNFAAAFGRATGATPREYRSRSKAGPVSH
jgi:AraC family transcriptional regulator